jgi:signal transduction histidine kinase
MDLQVQQLPTSPRQSAVSGGDRHIDERWSLLVIEPDMERKKVINGLLSGYADSIRARHVATARQAVGVSRSVSFDCVLLTDALPDSESLGLISLLRDPATMLQVPVVLMLKQRDDQAALDALHCGASEVIAFDRLNEHTVLEKIGSAIDRHKLEVSIAENRLQAELNALELARRQQYIAAKVDELTHAMRTPLGAINEFVSLVFDEVGGPISEQNRKFLALARGACWTLEREISALYEITDMSTHLNDSHKSSVQLQDIFQLVLDELQFESKFLDVSLCDTTDTALPAVHADSLQICQVLLQLVSRAMSIAGAGSTVSLHAHVPAKTPTQVEVCVRVQRCEAQTDNVQSIMAAPAHADRIAEQLEVRTCVELLEVHRATLEVRIEGADCATASFYLPASER